MNLLTRITLFPTLALLPFLAVGQANVSINNSLTVEQLVNDYLLGGGVTATNITFNGLPADQVYIQAGLYEGPSEVVAFNQGVVLATSNVNHVLTGSELGATPNISDADLAIIAGHVINNAAVLEFDFVVNSDSIKFNYVFASDEYPSFTCSSYNDPFGFFISGPGIDGGGVFENNAMNIALIPGTNTPVAINTVNSGTASGGYDPQTCAQANPDWVEHSQLYFQQNSNPGSNEVSYPGMTTTLTALASVECGEQYHIKMAVGNASDQGYQSGVFLEAGSFTSFGEIYVDFSPVFNEGGVVNQEEFANVIVAGCTAPEFQISRPAGATIHNLAFDYGGTAQEGVDFVFDGEFPTYFPDGIDTLYFVINTINPNITDTLYFELYSIFESCSSTDTIVSSIPIIPPPEILLEFENTEYFCPIDSVVVSVEASNALEPYEYTWEDFGEGQGHFIPIPEGSRYYVVSVTDACGYNTTVDSVLVTNSIPPPLTVNIDPFNDPSCPSEPVNFHASITGGLGEYYISWRDGIGQSWGNGEPDASSSYVFPTDVYVSVMDSCGTVVGDTVLVNVPQFDDITVDFKPLNNHCPDGSVELSADVKGGGGDNMVFWNIAENDGQFAAGFGPNDNPSYFIPEPGMNRVTFEVNDRCYREMLFGDYNNVYKEDSLMLPVIDLTALPNVLTPNGDNKNEAFIVPGINMFEDARVEFYDRWGKMVFEASTYTAGNADQNIPEGAFTAKDLSDGTYFYVVNVNSGECTRSGQLEVLRGGM